MIIVLFRVPPPHKSLLSVLERVLTLWVGLRHSCEIGDDMALYGWTEYDGRLGGKQIIKDRGMKLDLETEFIKVPAQNGNPFEGGELIVGGNWGVRIKGRPHSQESVTNIFFYAGLEGFGELQLSTPFDVEVRSRLIGR